MTTITILLPQLIPTEVKVRWVKYAFYPSGKKYAAIRRKARLPIDNCAICGKSLDEDVPLSLVATEGHDNHIVHASCLKERIPT